VTYTRFAELAQIRTWCREGRVITRGPLNVAYEISVDGRKAFVRQRISDDDEYGQTFAAERFLPAALTSRVRVPRLVQVLNDELDAPRFAVFEFIDGVSPDWSRTDSMDKLAEILLETHQHLGSGFGNVGEVLEATKADSFIGRLIDNELSRLPPSILLTRTLLGYRDLISASMRLFAGEAPVLCHGDVHPANFLSDHDGQLWALDWEAARFRVAAADFNQTHLGWLTESQQTALLKIYSIRSGRVPDLFCAQVRILQLLWHIRTFNFYTLILGRQCALEKDHLHKAIEIARSLDSGDIS
jgi:aminoglycoside phosphotransferase (APT) family kinase protein